MPAAQTMLPALVPVPPVLIVAPPPVGTAAGTMADKFGGADTKCVGLADQLGTVAAELGCPVFDAGAVIHASLTDGVHLDADQHITLGDALCETVSDLLRDD